MEAAAKDHETIANGAESPSLALLETLYNSRNPTRRWLHCTRRDWITAKVAEYAGGRSRRALEVGFGAGAYLPALCEAFREVVASDLDQTHVDHGHSISAKYPNLRLATDDITSSRLPERSFDLVLCSEVIEHIGDTTRVLSGVRRLLAPGGILILSTPQRYSLIEMACKVAFMPGVISVVRRIYGEPVLEAGHINLMTSHTVTQALEGHGFNVLESNKSGMYLPFLAEFAGDNALRLEQWLEKKLRNGPLSWMLWTQFYVARRLGA